MLIDEVKAGGEPFQCVVEWRQEECKKRSGCRVSEGNWIHEIVIGMVT